MAEDKVIPEWLQACVISEDTTNPVPVRAGDVSHNWPAMFIAYSRGAELPAIAEIFGVDLPMLERVAKKQEWDRVNERLRMEPIESESVLAERMQRIEENRLKNLELAHDLRTDLGRKFKALAEGTLKMQQVVKFKDGFDIAETDPQPKDIKALAEAARIMADITYRALGDVLEGERRAGDNKGSNGATSVAIQVNIPAAVSKLVEAGEVYENEA